jgi:hypothetical protein
MICYDRTYRAQPIKTLFQKIQDAQAFAIAGGQQYDNVMVVNIAFTLVFNTNLSPDECRAWQTQDAADQTWTQSKVDIATATREFRLTYQIAEQSGFHSANMMIKNNREGSFQGASDAIA